MVIYRTETARGQATRSATADMLAHLPPGTDWVQVDAIRFTANDKSDPVTWELERRIDLQGRAHR
jgi:hypothetical protein